MSEGMLKQAKARSTAVQWLTGPAEQLPFDDGALDAVVTTSAFHFFDQPVALREFHRVLRPGGLRRSPRSAHGKSRCFLLSKLRSTGSPPRTTRPRGRCARCSRAPGSTVGDQHRVRIGRCGRSCCRISSPWESRPDRLCRGLRWGAPRDAARRAGRGASVGAVAHRLTAAVVRWFERAVGARPTESDLHVDRRFLICLADLGNEPHEDDHETGRQKEHVTPEPPRGRPAQGHGRRLATNPRQEAGPHRRSRARSGRSLAPRHIFEQLAPGDGGNRRHLDMRCSLDRSGGDNSLARSPLVCGRPRHCHITTECRLVGRRGPCRDTSPGPEFSLRNEAPVRQVRPRLSACQISARRRWRRWPS